jgi:transposase
MLEATGGHEAEVAWALRFVAACKPKNLALTACMRKLLTILCAVAKACKPFNAGLHLA